MKARCVHRVATTLQPGDHPYLTGAWTPVSEEWDAEDLDVIAGEIPRALYGVYLRNTENPVQQPLGRYHPFDGDGLLCAIHFEDGRARFRNRFVRTAGFLAEQAAGRALWSGIAEMPPRSERPGSGAQGFLKDASSTDVVVHASRALTSFYQCGALYQLDPDTLEQSGAADWDGCFPAAGVSAHAKCDPRTGELLFFNYGRQAPFMHYGALDAQGRLQQYVPVPLPGPRLPHDLAYTPRHAILNDFPLSWDESLLPKNLFVARLHDRPSRFVLIDRTNPTQQRWFEAEPTYVLHFTNAWEEGDAVVLEGYRQRQPMPPPLAGAPEPYAQLLAYTDLHSLRPQLWRWRFDLRTGQTCEAAVDDAVCEFGRIHPQRVGQAHRYVYSALGERGIFLFTGLIQHDLATGRRERIDFGPGRYGSEAPFAPRPGAHREDDGWLLTFVTDLNADRSECCIYAADALAAGPVARVALPLRIPSGTHACWWPAAG